MKTKNSTELFQKLPPPYLIVGLGKSGSASQRLLQHLGVSSQSIFSFDDKAAANFDDPVLALKTVRPKTLIVSPGYPLSTPWIQEAKNSGVVITSELSIASSLLTNEKLIGVTGSVGKSTVCALLGAGFAGLGQDVLVCGNFGYPLADYVSDLLDNKCEPKEWLVVELSSYQLENCQGLQLHTSLIVSLTPNHLERYKTQLHYYSTKLNIFSLTTHYKICGKESAGLYAFFNEVGLGQHQAVLSECGMTSVESTLSDLILAEQPELLSNTIKNFLPDGKRYFNLLKTSQLGLPPIFHQTLIGAHNTNNILLCMAVFRLLNFSNQADVHLLGYSGLPHRLENLGEHNHILFINDSKATTLESLITAAKTIQASYPDRRAWLLVGGKDKNLPWKDLSRLDSYRNLKFLFFGECAAKAKSLSSLDGNAFESLALCLDHLKDRLQGHDVVLLSPGGTSFDEFKSFEDRGAFFKNWINKNFN